VAVVTSRLALVEFPADDPERALRFWGGVLGVEPEPRAAGEGEGWVARFPAAGGDRGREDGGGAAAVGIHRRGVGPGDSFSLPYFEVADIEAAASRVSDLGGTVIHPGERWTICKDSEGNPFALAAVG
jgi:predicted enzyme related to lactoylglutathione lyase